MITKTKTVRFKLSSWRKLRGLIKAKHDESFTAYLDRVVEYIKEEELQWQRDAA